MSHKVLVHIKSLPFEPRNGAAEYRPGSAHVLDSVEAYELDKAGIATIVNDPFVEPVPGGIPYLPSESSEEKSPLVELGDEVVVPSDERTEDETEEDEKDLKTISV